MDTTKLLWREQSRRELFKAKIFTLEEITSLSPRGETGIYTVMKSPDWVVVIPVLETGGEREFVLVRQWRHGSRELSLEFPGGVCELGESGEAAAARELLEETGFAAETIEKLGEMSPNPAIMSNRVHFCLARDLQNQGKQHLDADEYVDVEIVPAKQMIQNMGRPPYIHSLMASALMLYFQREH